MTVADLIKHLQEQEPTALVVLASDAEGNDISPLRALDACGYAAETTWSGHLCDDDRNEAGEVKAVVLWPVN